MCVPTLTCFQKHTNFLFGLVEIHVPYLFTFNSSCFSDLKQQEEKLKMTSSVRLDRYTPGKIY